MRRNLILFAIVIIALLISCKKSETYPTYLISQDSVYYTNAGQTMPNQVRRFLYNGNKQLVKIKYALDVQNTNNGSNWNISTPLYTKHDDIVYNGNGQVSAVYSYVGSSLIGTTTYSYISGNLASISIPSDTVSFLYSSGKTSTIYHNYIYNNHYYSDTINSIVYSGDNVTSLKFNRTPLTVTVDKTAANPYYGVYPINNDFVYYTDFINKNNITNIKRTEDSTTADQKRYTYANGRVSTITYLTNSPETITYVITYNGY